MRPEPPDKNGKKQCAATAAREGPGVSAFPAPFSAPLPGRGECSRWFRGLRAAKSSGPPPPAKIPGAASRRGFPVLHDPPLKRRAKIRRSLRDLHWRSSPAVRRYTFGIRAIFLIGVTIVTLDSREIMENWMFRERVARGRCPRPLTIRGPAGMRRRTDILRQCWLVLLFYTCFSWWH